jgi:glucose-specific phosphotransferase system IIA component
MIIEDFACPLTGRLMRIEDVPDEIFSDRVMGDGFAVEVEGNDVLAPIDGVIDSIFPGGHAVCIKGDNGINVLIHVGLESYKIPKLNTIYVQAGDRVKQGQRLVKTNWRKLKNASSAISPVVFLAQETIHLKKTGPVKAGEKGFLSIETK